MWPFKEKTPDEIMHSLVKKCNKEYQNFHFHLTQAHTESYYLFKRAFKEDLTYIKEKISESDNIELTIDLLKHFKKQLNFITKNPFIAKMDDFDQFLAENYPYKDKVNKIINSHTAKKIIKHSSLNV